MLLKNKIEELGLNIVLKSFFPNLLGIDYTNVICDNIYKNNIIEYMTSDLDGSWHLGVGKMPMLFKSVSKENEVTELTKLLLSNQIILDDKYNDKEQKHIDKWKGNGYIVEKSSIDNITIIVITASIHSLQEVYQIFNKTNLAKPIEEQLNWIEGFDVIYDAKSISKKDKEESLFINVPILYKSDIDYILISVKNAEIAKVIIDRIMLNNGGFHSFCQEDLSKYNELTFLGYAFIMGYLPDSKTIKINKLLSNSKDRAKELSPCIHPLSAKLKSSIDGFENVLYANLENDYKDGRFLAKDENASIIEACFEDPLLAINIFKDVVFSYNIEDEFLCIKEDSIVELFNRVPEDVITFDVDQKFRFDLLKVNSIYKLKLFPPGGIYGDWTNFNKAPLNEDAMPIVEYSQFSQDLITKKM